MQEHVKSKVLCFNNYSHFFFSNGKLFFDFLWNIHANCARKIFICFPELIIKTLDGSILLVVWPGFLWINFPFREGYLKDVKVTYWGCSVTGWSGGRGEVRRGLLSTGGDAWSPRIPSPTCLGAGFVSQQLHEPQTGRRATVGGPPPGTWGRTRPLPIPNASVHFFFTCLAVKHTCSEFILEMTLVGVHSMAGVRK